MHALLTICLPTYNRKRQLETFMPVLIREIDAAGGPVPVVIADDASSDGTFEYLSLLAASRPWLTIVRQERNLGGSGNVHWFLRNPPNAEYLWILGDDDLLEPRTVAQVLYYLETRRPSWIFLPHAFEEPSGWPRLSPCPPELEVLEGGPEVFKKYYHWTSFTSACIVRTVDLIVGAAQVRPGLPFETQVWFVLAALDKACLVLDRRTIFASLDTTWKDKLIPYWTQGRVKLFEGGIDKALSAAEYARTLDLTFPGGALDMWSQVEPKVLEAVVAQFPSRELAYALCVLQMRPLPKVSVVLAFKSAVPSWVPEFCARLGLPSEIMLVGSGAAGFVPRFTPDWAIRAHAATGLERTEALEVGCRAALGEFVFIVDSAAATLDPATVAKAFSALENKPLAGLLVVDGGILIRRSLVDVTGGLVDGDFGALVEGIRQAASASGFNESTAGVPPRGDSRFKRAIVVADHLDSWGQVAPIALEMGRKLLEAGFEVDLMTSYDPALVGREVAGMRVLPLAISGSPMFGNSRGEEARARAILENGGYEAAVFVGDPMSWALWLMEGGSVAGTKAIAVPLIDNRALARWGGTPAAREKVHAMLTSADAIACLNGRAGTRRFLEDEALPFMVIPEPLPTQPAEAGFRRRFNIAEGPLVVVAADYVSTEAQDRLLLAMRYADFKATIALIGQRDYGGLSYFRQLETLVAADSRFLLLPGLSRGEVAAAIREADLVVQPGVSETVPFAIAQAMAFGRPWLAVPHAAPLHAAKGGIIGGVEQLPAALSRLLTFPLEAARLGEEGRGHWEAHLSAAAIGAGLLELLNGASTKTRTQELPDMPERRRFNILAPIAKNLAEALAAYTEAFTPSDDVAMFAMATEAEVLEALEGGDLDSEAIPDVVVLDATSSQLPGVVRQVQLVLGEGRPARIARSLGIPTMQHVDALRLRAAAKSAATRSQSALDLN